MIDEKAGKWVEKSPMLDGSGVYRANGIDYKIIVQDLISTKHRAAFLNGKEVARAGKFAALVRKIEALGND